MKSQKSFMILIVFLTITKLTFFLCVGQSGAGNNQAKERYTKGAELVGSVLAIGIREI